MAIVTHRSVWLLHLPTSDQLTAAHTKAGGTGRWLTVVGLRADGPESPVIGWGECAALNEPTYTPEWAAGAYSMLTAHEPVDHAGSPLAAAALAMADLDASLRAQGRSLADHLGTAGRRVRAGAVVGLGSIDETVTAVDRLVQTGYRRIKLKVTPNHLADPIRAVTATYPGLEVQADANGSLTEVDVPALLAATQAGLRAIEQPFGVGDLDAAARLVATGEIQVVADEALTTPDDVERLAAAGAATAVTIKPPKLGGLAPALDALALAQAVGMGATIGGMLESGLGRHQLAALAGDPRLTLTGDVSPARRWLAQDPFEDLVMQGSEIVVPDRVGIAGDPDPDTMARFTTAAKTIRVDRPT